MITTKQSGDMETKDFFECKAGIVKLICVGADWWVHMITPQNTGGKVLKCVSESQAVEMFATCKNTLDPEVLLN